jgi:cGMP-dependent protein kinase
MVRGDFYGELMLVKGQNNPASIVAVRDNTVVLVLTMVGLTEALGQKDDAATTAMLLSLSAGGGDSSGGGGQKAIASAKVPFTELRFHRVVGRGQFGAVRMATHAATGQTFAIKTLYKAPITDAKQVEHIINELNVLQACCSPFCVQVRCLIC